MYRMSEANAFTIHRTVISLAFTISIISLMRKVNCEIARGLVTYNYIRGVSTPLGDLFSNRETALLKCSVQCSVYKKCVGFDFDQQDMSCKMYRKKEDGPKRSLFLLQEKPVDEKSRDPVTSTSQTSVAIGCGEPNIDHAVTARTLGMIGDIVRYTCLYRHTRCKTAEKDSITCLSTGQWSKPPGICHRNQWHGFPNEHIINVTCPIDDGALITFQGRPGNTSNTLLCNMTYNLHSKDAIYSNSISCPKEKDKKCTLEVKTRTYTSEWTELKPTIQPFEIAAKKLVNIKFRVMKKGIVVNLYRKTITRYSVSKKIEINRIGINSNLQGEKVVVNYKVARPLYLG